MIKSKQTKNLLAKDELNFVVENPEDNIASCMGQSVECFQPNLSPKMKKKLLKFTGLILEKLRLI